MSLCGGLTAPSRPSNDDLNILMPVIEKYLEEECGQKPSDIKITEVEHDGKVWHIRVHQQLPCYGGLVSVHSHKVAQPNDLLTYF
nr:hypothetical transcript [Hymenolepis microstoma]